MKIFLRSIFVIGFFFGVGLVVAKLGMISPKLTYPDSFLGWFLLIIVLIVIDMIFEFIFEKLDKRFGFRFWERFSDKEIKLINTIIIVLLVLVTLTSVICGLLF